MRSIDTAQRSILKKSAKLFASEGFKGLSMRKLAKELNVTTGTLYHYFPNKFELYEKMLAELAINDAEDLLNLIEGKELQVKKEIFLNFITSRSDYFHEIVLIMLDVYRIFIQDKTDYEDHQIVQLFETSVEIYNKTISEIFEVENFMVTQGILDQFIGFYTRTLLMGKKTLDFSSLEYLVNNINPTGESL